MDPVAMEGKGGEPVAFPRVLSVVKATASAAAVAAGSAGGQEGGGGGALQPAGNRGAVGPPEGPMDVDSPRSPAQRRRAGRKAPASPTAVRQPLSPASPTAAQAAAAALAAAAQRGGGGAQGGPAGAGRELVPLPDQLQAAVDAALASEQLRPDSDFCSDKYRAQVGAGAWCLAARTPRLPSRLSCCLATPLHQYHTHMLYQIITSTHAPMPSAGARVPRATGGGGARRPQAPGPAARRARPLRARAPRQPGCARAAAFCALRSLA